MYTEAARECDNDAQCLYIYTGIYAYPITLVNPIYIYIYVYLHVCM